MICYELYLRSFFDDNGDGIGDLKGLKKKLDYFVELGIDCIWFLPILKSPAFHGYTISDFYSVNPAYGNIEDLKEVIEEGHKRGLKFVLDLPVNHCSISSKWFQKALNNELPYKNWFLWSKDKNTVQEKRHWGNDKIWFKTKDKFFYALFGPGSPDLNFEEKSLWEEMQKVFEFWLEVGFDGFRLDAAKHIFDYDTKNMKFKYFHDKNINFWKIMIDYIKNIKKDAIIISEVWDDHKIVKKYDGVFDIGFNFPISYVIKEAVKNSSPNHLLKGIKECLKNYFEDQEIKTISGNFLTNHDMTRLMSELKSKKLYRFALSILFTLPGFPFMYYGEELGMKGKIKSVNFTEDSHEPIHWYDIGFGPGQTEWKGYKFNPPYSGVAIEKQIKDKNSNFSYVKSLITFRKKLQDISKAKISILKQDKNMLKLRVFNQLFEYIVYYNFNSEKCLIDLKNSENYYIFGKKAQKNNKIYLEKYSTAVVIIKQKE